MNHLKLACAPHFEFLHRFRTNVTYDNRKVNIVIPIVYFYRYKIVIYRRYSNTQVFTWIFSQYNLEYNY